MLRPIGRCRDSSMIMFCRKCGSEIDVNVIPNEYMDNVAAKCWLDDNEGLCFLCFIFDTIRIYCIS